MGRMRLPIDKVMGDRLMRIIREQGLSQAQFADAVGISPYTVNGIINLLQPMNEVIAERINKAYPQYGFLWLMNYDRYVDRFVASEEGE